MIVDPKVIALLSASLFLATSATMAKLAVDYEDGRIASQTVSAPQACPPGACTIVVKTEPGGPPSEIHTVADPQAPSPLVRLAAREPSRF